MATSVKIAVVGDHDDWNLQLDSQALHLLQPDLVLFTGDFGNENVELIKSVADLTIAKAVILGNHDAWSTQKFNDRKKDPVQLQLDCLGKEHVGYRRLNFPALKLSIVGGRPFSCGGQRLFRHKLLSARFNINDICGRDWIYGGGDHGDPDLEHAISQLKETTKLSVPLVVFGHMHKQLAMGNGLRKMVVVGDDNSIYLNGAIVPRVKRLANEHKTDSNNCLETENCLLTPELEGTIRAFTIVEILEGRLEKISETWVSVMGDKTTLEEEHIIFSSGPSVSMLSMQYFD